MKISKDFSFEAAHRLQNHDGKCRGLHGHSYRVRVTAKGKNLQDSGPGKGMLIDFSALSVWWRKIGSMLDHRVILELGDPLVAALSPHVDNLFTVAWPPTAEHFAFWLQADLERDLREEYPSLTARVRVYETATSWAEA